MASVTETRMLHLMVAYGDEGLIEVKPKILWDWKECGRNLLI